MENLSFEQRYKARYVRPAKEKEEWPEGKLANPSLRIPLSDCLQIAAETRKSFSGILSAKPPTTYRARFAMSGSHLLNRSGRGFPKRLFIPSVNINVTAQPRHSPSKPVFNSQNFWIHRRLLDVVFGAVEPGTRNKQIMKMTAAGKARERTKSTPVEIFSLRTYGKEILVSSRENGRRLPVMREKAPPMAAMMLLRSCQRIFSHFRGV